MDKKEQEIKANIIKNLLSNRHRKTASSPAIGVWWLNKNKTRVIFKEKIYLTDKSNLEEYDDSVVTKNDHYSMWETLSENDILRNNGDPEDYTSLPRGRVIYDKIEDKYVIFSGSWFTGRIKALIAQEYGLPLSKVEIEYDEHYD